MSKIAEVAPAMSALKTRLEQRAAKLLERVAAADRSSEASYSIADQHLDAHEADLRVMESELRQLGNLPPLEQSSAPLGEAAPKSADTFPDIARDQI